MNEALRFGGYAWLKKTKQKNAVAYYHPVLLLLLLHILPQVGVERATVYMCV